MNNVPDDYTGKIIKYNNDGTKSTEHNYINGKKNGKACCWDKNGETLECYYKNDVKHGIYLCKYSNGAKKYECEFINGRMEGPEYLYNIDGTLKLENQYSKGLIVSRHEFLQNYIDKIDEVYVEYYINGIEKLRYYKFKSKLHGKYIERNYLGEITNKFNYNNGIKIKLIKKTKTRTCNYFKY
jgi:hypothetical protein